MVHTFNSSTQEAEAGRSLSLRPAWSTEWVSGQPGIYREILSQEKKKVCVGAHTGYWQVERKSDSLFKDERYY